MPWIDLCKAGIIINKNIVMKKDSKQSREIEKLKEENEKLTNQLKRALADYINLQKTIDTRLDVALTQQSAKIARGLITLLDDIYMAKQAYDQIEFGEKEKAWADGVIGSLSKLSATLDELGITPIVASKGTAFDSNLHEAISTIPVERNGKPGEIVDVIQQGYRIGDIVIRPARVVVSRNA